MPRKNYQNFSLGDLEAIAVELEEAVFEIETRRLVDEFHLMSPAEIKQQLAVVGRDAEPLNPTSAVHAFERRKRDVSRDRSIDALPDKYPFELAASTSADQLKSTVLKDRIGTIWVNNVRCDLFADKRSRKFFVGPLLGSPRKIILIETPYQLNRDSGNAFFEIVGLRQGDVADVLDTHREPERSAYADAGACETSSNGLDSRSTDRGTGIRSKPI